MSSWVFVLPPEYHGISLLSQSLLGYFMVAQNEGTKGKFKRKWEKEAREKNS